MLMGEFLALVQYDLPVKVVLFDNSSSAWWELEMMVAGLPSYGTANTNPDFCRAHRPGLRRVRGASLEKPKHLAGALRDAFRHKGPALVDPRHRPQRHVHPPKIGAAMVTGFALSCLQDRLLDGGVRPDAPGPAAPTPAACCCV